MKNFKILGLALLGIAISIAIFNPLPAIGGKVLSGLTLMQLGQLAKTGQMPDYSSMDGDDDEGFEDFMSYTGEDDDMFDFGGTNRSFAGMSDMMFVMSITGHATIADSAYIVPGYNWYPGKVANGYVNTTFNGIGGNALTAASLTPNKTIEDFFAFIKSNPIVLAGIKIEGTVTSQVAGVMIYQKLSPFKDLETKTFALGAYQNENTYRDKIVTVPTPGLVLSDQTRVILPITPANTATLTFFVQAVNNPSYTTEKRAQQAINNIKSGARPTSVANRIPVRPGAVKR